MENKKSKVVKHKKIEQCALTKKKINTDIDDYSIIIDCRGKEIVSTKFYKTEFLADLIKGNAELIKNELWKRTQNVTQGMLQKLGLSKPVYQVK